MAIKLRTVIRHPATVEGETGIVVEKENGVYTYSLDFSEFELADTIPDASVAFVPFYTEGTEPVVYSRVSLEAFAELAAAELASPFMVTLLDDADAATARATLGLTIGTNVQAFNALLADIAGITFAQGDVIYHNGTNLVKLGAGTSGHFLKTQGAGANPAWAAVPGGGDMLAANNLSDVANTTTARQNIHAALRGHIFGLTLSNNGTDATNDIDIAVGEAADSNGAYLLRLTSGLTKRIDASWAVGSGNGGFDTGSVATDGKYYIWLIQRSDTGVVDALFSASATAPTMPTNYDRKRRIGSIVRLVSTNKPFSQIGDDFFFTTPVVEFNSITVGTTRTTTALVSAPANTVAKLRVYAFNGSAAASLVIQRTAEADAGPATAGYSLADDTANKGAAGEYFIPVNSSSQMSMRAAAVGTTVLGHCYGYNDSRDRLA